MNFAAPKSSCGAVFCETRENTYSVCKPCGSAPNCASALVRDAWTVGRPSRQANFADLQSRPLARTVRCPGPFQATTIDPTGSANRPLDRCLCGRLPFPRRHCCPSSTRACCATPASPSCWRRSPRSPPRRSPSRLTPRITLRHTPSRHRPSPQSNRLVAKPAAPEKPRSDSRHRMRMHARLGRPVRPVRPITRQTALATVRSKQTQARRATARRR